MSQEYKINTMYSGSFDADPDSMHHVTKAGVDPGRVLCRTMSESDTAKSLESKVELG